ncbi:hypothetical protein AAMO2058_000493600 [Amorphochlora amoebiformis]
MAPGFHLGLRLCDALQHLGIVDTEECDIIASNNSDRPIYLNLQFLLAPIVGLVILICFVFEDICLSDVGRTSDGVDGDEADSSREGEKKPKADVGRGDDDAGEQPGGDMPVENVITPVGGSEGSLKRHSPLRLPSLKKEKKSRISRLLGRSSRKDKGKGKRSRWCNWFYGLLALGGSTYDGPLRLTLVDEDGLSNCYHVRGELPLHELLQIHCGKEPSSLILRHSGRRLDPGVTIAGAGLKDLDVLDLESNYRKLFRECRLEAEENNRHLRQQLDLTHRDIQMQQGRLSQFERQMKNHARCAKSNEQQARDYQTRLKRLTADIAALQKMSVAQQKTQKLLERSADNLRSRLEETGRTVGKTKDPSWMQTLMGAAKSEIQNLSSKLSKASGRVAELEQKGSSASIVKELEDRLKDTEKRVAQRELEVAEWKEKWEASNRQAKAAMKAVKANRKAKRLEEEQQKVESNRQKDKYTHELNALKQKLETQRKASEQQWRRLQESKTQIERLKRKLSSQEEKYKSLEKDMESKQKDMQETCTEWKTKARSNARVLSETRTSLQQANKRGKDLQKWKREAEEDVIPKLKRRVEELQKEVESWKKRAHVYSEELKEALAKASQAKAAAAAVAFTSPSTTQSTSSTKISASNWGVPNGIGLPVPRIGSNLPWGSTNIERGSTRFWDPLPRNRLHANGSRWASFDKESSKSVGAGVPKKSGTVSDVSGVLASGTKSKSTTNAWSLPDDSSSFGSDFKTDGSSVVGSGRDRSLLVGIDGSSRSANSTTGESMFGKLALTNRSKPLVIVDDSNNTQSPHTKS